MSLRRRLGINLRAMRRLCGLSQSDLAKLSGVNKTHIGYIENGHVSTSVDILESLAIALETDPCLLMAKTSVKLKGTGIKEIKLIPVKIKKGEAAFCFWTNEGMEYHPFAKGSYNNALMILSLIQENGITGKELFEKTKKLHFPTGQK